MIITYQPERLGTVVLAAWPDDAVPTCRALWARRVFLYGNTLRARPISWELKVPLQGGELPEVADEQVVDLLCRHFEGERTGPGILGHSTHPPRWVGMYRGFRVDLR